MIRIIFKWTLAVLVLTGCQDKTEQEVVVYTSHDQILSEPVLKQFYKKTGIKVKAVYDIEANKTTGLVNRLIAEKQKPRADVFWNNEYLNTLKLQEMGVLEAFTDPLITSSDKQVYWSGFAARGRVFIVNKNLVKPDKMPQRLEDLTDPEWKGKVAIANPHFGTTGTHFSNLLAYWGENKFTAWLQALKNNDTAVLPGNAQVKDKVAAGHYWVGLTDTDDVNGALLDKKPVLMKVPDQGEDQMGVFVIPNSVALIKRGPNPEQAKQFIEYILSKDIEAQLASARGAQIPIRHSVKGPTIIPDSKGLIILKPKTDVPASKLMKQMLSIFRRVFYTDGSV